MVIDARWFQSLGPCACGCGKPADGILRGLQNQVFGSYRKECAAVILKEAALARAHENRKPVEKQKKGR